MISGKNLLLVVLVVSLAGTLSTISYEYSLYTSQQIEGLAIEDVRSNTDIQVYDLASSFSNKLGDIVNTLQIISRSTPVLGGNVESAKPIFNQAEDSNPKIIDFYMWLDNEGKLVWLSNINQTTYEQYRNTDLSYRLYFITPKDTHQLYYSSVIDSNDHVQRLYISYPILAEPSGQFKGTVVAGIRSDAIGHFLEDQLSPNLKSEVTLLDNTGIILYSKYPQYIGKNVFGIRFQTFLASNLETLKAMDEGFKQALSGNSGSSEIVRGEDKATFVYKPIILEGKQFGVLYAVTPHVYASDVAGLIDRQKNFSLMLIAITAAAALATIFIILIWNKKLEQTVNTKTAQLRVANEQLKTQDKMQKEFINIAAHELRTPIQPILGVAEMLEDELGQKREDVKMIARNARRLERLTRDLLDVARIESQTLKLGKEKFDICELVSTVVQDYRNRLTNGRDITVEYVPKEAIVVEADRERIIQVLSNLLDNAFKFTERGKVIVTVNKQSDGHGTVSVQDTGKGIEPDIFPRLFTKFVSNSQSGTGLGLFISKSIVEAHGGKIWGENNDGEGAKFTFTIP